MAKSKTANGGGRNKSKQTKKFVASGQLANTIKDRKRKQDVKRKIDNRKALRGKHGEVGYGQQYHQEDAQDGEDGGQGAAAAAAASVSRAKTSNSGGKDGEEDEDSGDEM
jgi:hypothetical protein